MSTPYRILSRKRAGESLAEEEIRSLVGGAVDGSWSEGQLAAFLMAAAIRGLDGDETRALTLAMLESGETWELDREIPALADKHSTGGVGDKVSLVLAPLLAACDRPIVMLTGRGLGHTGGTADKLETVPGLDIGLDRASCLKVLRSTGMAIGMATADIAPADRRLYALRDQTATVESVPLITASILSKKIATGAAALVFDVKTGNGAFMPELEEAVGLARLLVETSRSLGRRSSALITDMSQPLGRWVGHRAEVTETLECLGGEGPEDLMEVVLALAEEIGTLTDRPLERSELLDAVESGRARDRFDEWVAAQGGRPGKLAEAMKDLAPVEIVVEAPRSGFLNRVATRRLGLLLGEAGGGRTRPGGEIDGGISLRYLARLGREVEQGDELARLYLRRRDERLVEEFRRCFEVGAEALAPPALIVERV